MAFGWDAQEGDYLIDKIRLCILFGVFVDIAVDDNRLG